MTGTTEYKDLCSTCNYGPTCVRRKHHGKPVWQCEEFDDYQPVPKRTIIRTTAEERKTTAGKPSVAFQGLCANCESNQFCVIPKTEGGVWHCEEYT